MISGSLHFQIDPSPYPVQARRLIEHVCNVSSVSSGYHAVVPVESIKWFQLISCTRYYPVDPVDIIHWQSFTGYYLVVPVDIIEWILSSSSSGYNLLDIMQWMSSTGYCSLVSIDIIHWILFQRLSPTDYFSVDIIHWILSNGSCGFNWVDTCCNMLRYQKNVLLFQKQIFLGITLSCCFHS